MLIQKNSVIVIDNSILEVKDLFIALAKNGISYGYFDGDNDNLPPKPLVGIRAIFLDIELNGSMGLSDKIKVSVLMNVLSRIISQENGPYILVFWTKHQSVIEGVINGCNRRGIKPIFHIDLEKGEHCDGGGNFDLQSINNIIQNKLSTVGVFQLLLDWENSIYKALDEYMNVLAPRIENWDRLLLARLYSLYKANFSNGEEHNDNEKLHITMSMINTGLYDEIQKYTLDNVELPSGCRIINDNWVGVNNNEKLQYIAKLNSSIFISEKYEEHNIPGRVYCVDARHYKGLKKAITESFPNISSDNNGKLCYAVITPGCDIANRKILKRDNKQLHRVIFGILIDENNEDFKDKQSVFISGPIFLHRETKIKKILFHCGVVTYLSQECFTNDDFYFNLKDSLLVDLQTIASRHISRIGNNMIRKV